MAAPAAQRWMACEESRCEDCPWPAGVECGGAAGHCVGNGKPDFGFPISDRCYCGEQPDDQVAQPHQRGTTACRAAEADCDA